MQDEHWFAVPGWTVAREGIPRMPYVPVEDKASVFYHAQHVLFALPPAFFYLQGPFFAVLEATYTTARWPSWVAGMIVLWVLERILARLGVTFKIRLPILAICGLSRPFFFAWTNSRPDMLCAACGITAMYFGLRYWQSPTWSLAALAGLFVGLGLFSHPFAIVFVFQFSFLVLVLAKPPQVTPRPTGATKIFGWNPGVWSSRLIALCLAGTCAAIALALWIPLILVDSEVFWIQFSNNVLSRSGPGLHHRIVWPGSSIAHQSNMFYLRNGAIQSTLCVCMLAAGAWMLVRRRRQQEVYASALMLVGVYFHIVSVGFHVLMDYWCYTWCWIMIVLALTLQSLSDAVERLTWQRGVVPGIVCIILLFLVPGSGVRATWTYATRSHELAYNRSAFCQHVMSRLPVDAKLLVASDYVFEFEASGRNCVIAYKLERYLDASDLDFDYWVASRSNSLEQLPQSIGCQKLWSQGDWNDSLSCYVDVYAPPKDRTDHVPWPRNTARAAE
jgi:hypothetical protein